MTVFNFATSFLCAVLNSLIVSSPPPLKERESERMPNNKNKQKVWNGNSFISAIKKAPTFISRSIQAKNKEGKCQESAIKRQEKEESRFGNS